MRKNTSSESEADTRFKGKEVEMGLFDFKKKNNKVHHIVEDKPPEPPRSIASELSHPTSLDRESACDDIVA